MESSAGRFLVDFDGAFFDTVIVLYGGMTMYRARSDRRSSRLRLLPFSVTLLLTGFFFGSPAIADDCESIGGNQVTSCGFESPGEVAAWSHSSGTLAFAAGLGETGNGGLGTAEDFGSLWVFGFKSPCFAATPGQELDLGYWVRLFSGVAPDRCSAGWQQFSDLSCSGANGGGIGTDQFVPGAAYIEVTGSHLVGAGTVAMRLAIDCRSTAGDFEVLVDNGYAKDASYIFDDGFESGDTSAWSSTVP
jgi:hypothetical protein